MVAKHGCREHVRQCDGCQDILPKPTRAPLHPWEMPRSAWERIHVDYAGPVDGQVLFVAVDTYSKWFEVFSGSSCTSWSAVTISYLRRMMLTHGVPALKVSYNGPAFVSAEFQQFCQSNGIQHTQVVPYHLSLNGLVERAVHTVKQVLSHRKHGKPLLER